MNKGRLLIISGFLLLAACGKKEPVSQPSLPGIRAELKDITAFSVSFEVQAVKTATLRYGVDEEMSESRETGSIGPVTLSLQLDRLTPLTDYTLYVKGIGPGGEQGNIVTLPFSTPRGPGQLYSWEEKRNGPPAFADISLVTLGWHNYNPPAWTAERFASHVEYTGPDGKARWLFDSFLCIDGWDPARNLSFSITNGRYSAVKESWEDLLEAWLGTGGALLQLDAAIENASARLGRPSSPRYVIMGIPDPIRYQLFSDKQSSTAYWGSVNGKALDFSHTEDQIAAYRWYMDLCRSRFNSMNFKHLELAGFYILSEELPLDPAFFKATGQDYSSAYTWNWEQKNWEIILPQVSSYAHSCKEGLWWIPYHLAPGYKVWKQLGFDQAWMQPNYYWDHGQTSHPLSSTKEALRKYRMGIELEFEYSLVASVMADGRSGPDGNGNPVFYAADVPLLRGRVREYMQMYRDSGLYGELPVAVYSGTDAWHQLATSEDPEDKAMFREICTFIVDSPLKK